MKSTIDSGPLGGFRIKEGLFVGDALSATDCDFLFFNKISHVVYFGPLPPRVSQIKLLTLPWASGLQPDLSLLPLAQIEDFLRQAEDSCGALLLCSNPLTRSLAVSVTLLCRRFRWTPRKAADFVTARKDNLRLSSELMQAIKAVTKHEEKASRNWESLNSAPEFREEEKLLRNTYLNSVFVDSATPAVVVSKKKVTWEEFRAQKVFARKPSHKELSKKSTKIPTLDAQTKTMISPLLNNYFYKSTIEKRENSQQEGSIKSKLKLAFQQKLEEKKQPNFFLSKEFVPFKQLKYTHNDKNSNKENVNRRNFESCSEVDAKARHRPLSAPIKDPAKLKTNDVNFLVTGFSTSFSKMNDSSKKFFTRSLLGNR